MIGPPEDGDDFTATLVELLDALGASDPNFRRFGAASHRWQRRPPLSIERLGAIEAETGVTIPGDLAAYLTRVGDGGAGPYHGLVPLDHATQILRMRGPCPLPARAAPWSGGDPWRGAIAIADLGCDQAALLVVDGPARGSVWADVRAAGAGVIPIAASFADFLVVHLAAMATGELPPPVAPPARCALPRLLSALLAREEERLGLPADTLAGEPLRAVLRDLAPGSIAIASAGSALFAPGDPIAPCVACAGLIERLGADGLAPDVVAPGVPPLPAR